VVYRAEEERHDPGIGGKQIRLLEPRDSFESPRDAFKRPGSFDKSIGDILRTRVLGKLGELNATEARVIRTEKTKPAVSRIRSPCGP
jgi:hypothetical protein